MVFTSVTEEIRKNMFLNKISQNKAPVQRLPITIYFTLG